MDTVLQVLRILDECLLFNGHFTGLSSTGWRYPKPFADGLTINFTSKTKGLPALLNCCKPFLLHNLANPMDMIVQGTATMGQNIESAAQGLQNISSEKVGNFSS